MNTLSPLADRRSAGCQLATRLGHLRDSDPIVLALPRGGVPVGYEIARALDAELGLVMVRKLGAPGHPKFAIGAVIDGDDPQVVFNEDAMRIVAPAPDYVKEEAGRQLIELERRRHAYIGEKRIPQLGERTVILVDDGVATGSTVTAALRAIRRHDPGRLILAVPVAPPDTLEKLRPLCDDLVVLAIPQPFYTVGHHYRDFRQVNDREVIDLLAAAEKREAAND
ncbi:phosphoribosyltransferase [Altererythrobacter sp. KTW20L]|uniref:phosphoribosyltransferase n=1 Tax=Altererythrobacter sp. KTW20L TaxID=2942210 RepID=UPI0020BDC8CC|nr:phosphoribosyltransferase [Altererythrobacter sp. KTW20L]MCL6251228.1 phosphoribosyltransferase [Altererythrobacter sp. KTW20L]